MSPRWKSGHQVELLENGEAFYPAVFDAIASARQEVLIETFILFEDKVGYELQRVLIAAARRGVHVELTVDGFGSGDLTPAFQAALTEAGVQLHVFDPKPRTLGLLRTNWFRRMHRKLAVIDGTLAFVGGINYSADHLGDFGPEAKQDYACSVEGPVVAEIHRFMHRQLRRASGRRWFHRRPPLPPLAAQREAGPAQALFVVRDNGEHRSDIERHYRAAIRAAKRDVLIANAYFFPGWRLLKELRRAARRGVRVRLVLQGEPDMAIVKTAAGMLYEHLLRAGVEVHEYCKRPLHGKVALVDDEWATVGSSNLDPLSLSLNLEANLVVRDPGFNACLRERLERLIADDCHCIASDPQAATGWWASVRSAVVFHVLRRFPAWLGWLPAHAPTLESAPLRGRLGQPPPAAEPAPVAADLATSDR